MSFGENFIDDCRFDSQSRHFETMGASIAEVVSELLGLTKVGQFFCAAYLDLEEIVSPCSGLTGRKHT